MIALLDRERIADASFRAAVAAIHGGDARKVAMLIAAEPRLLTDRILGPEAYRQATRHQYFRDPKLFWYVANNPKTTPAMAPNIVEVAQVMIARGVAQSDLDYTLELVMSSAVAREQGHQVPLARALIAAGAIAGAPAIRVAAAHGELDVLRALVADGLRMTAPLAAALGESEQLAAFLNTATPADTQDAFGLAVINRNLAGARAALDAGADVNAWLPVHTHATALHQAAGADDVAMLEMLLGRGAGRTIRDRLWDATPLGWATHAGHAGARRVLAER